MSWRDRPRMGHLSSFGYFSFLTLSLSEAFHSSCVWPEWVHFMHSRANVDCEDEDRSDVWEIFRSFKVIMSKAIINDNHERSRSIFYEDLVAKSWDLSRASAAILSEKSFHAFISSNADALCASN